MKISKKASLKKFNTFNVSETANIIYEVEEISELKGILSNNKGQILILGGGSNILFTKRFEGTIINLKNKGIKVIRENKDSILVEVSAGENWNDFVIWAVENNYGGIENLSLIPLFLRFMIVPSNLFVNNILLPPPKIRILPLLSDKIPLSSLISSTS